VSRKFFSSTKRLKVISCSVLNIFLSGQFYCISLRECFNQQQLCPRSSRVTVSETIILVGFPWLDNVIGYPLPNQACACAAFRAELFSKFYGLWQIKYL